MSTTVAHVKLYKDENAAELIAAANRFNGYPSYVIPARHYSARRHGYLVAVVSRIPAEHIDYRPE